jgi:hypothetical protein
MKSLEDAIAAAKCDFDEGESLTIDRTKFASRKRGRISVISRGKDRLEIKDVNMHEEVPSEVAFWRDKYESLRSVKVGAEEELEAQLELMTEREGKLEKYAKLLERKIEILNESGQKKSSAEIEQKLDGYRKKLSFYEVMTSMTIKCEENEEYICTVKNKLKRIATRFKIVLANDLEGKEASNSPVDIQYVPTANADLLPEYLQSEISFEENIAPVLLGDILHSLYDEAM